MNWEINDFKIFLLETQMKILKEEFDKSHSPADPKYYQKLENFFKRKLRKYTIQIMREQLALSISPLILPNRNL